MKTFQTFIFFFFTELELNSGNYLELNWFENRNETEINTKL